eukprot:PhF_6_TR32127/c0_g1_i1/m.47558
MYQFILTCVKTRQIKSPAPFETMLQRLIVPCVEVLVKSMKPCLPSLTKKVDMTSFSEEVQDYVIGVGGASTLGGLIIVVAMWGWSVYKSKTTVQEILPVPLHIENFTNFTLTLCVMLMLCCAVCFTALLYFYSTATLYSQILALMGLPVPAVLWMITLISFLSIWWMSSVGMGISGFVLLCSACVCFGIGVTLLYYYENASSTSVVNLLHKQWDDAVLTRPDWICTAEETFRCSGFLHPCHEAINSTSCPTDCSVANTYTDACYEILTRKFKQQLLGPVILLLIFGALLLTYSVCCMYLCCDLMWRRVRMMERRKARVHDGGYEASTQELEMIKAEFFKAAGDNQMLDPNEFENFFRRAFCEVPAKEDLYVIQRSIDTNGDGKISWDEFWTMYTRKKEVSDGVLFKGCLSNQEADNALYEGGHDKLQAAIDALKRSPESYLCAGLNRFEMDMLREKWDSIHLNPATPYLSSRELRDVCTLMCGLIDPTDDQTSRLARRLDVHGRGVDKIGFREFCFPYAQRAQLRFSRDVITCMNREGMINELGNKFSPYLGRNEAEKLMEFIEVKKDVSDLYFFQVSVPLEVLYVRLVM